MPAANASIAHLLIDATIPYPDLDPVLHALIYIYRLPQRHSHSGLAVASGSCSLGARATRLGPPPLGALATWTGPLIGYWALAFIRPLFSFPLPENTFLPPRFDSAPPEHRSEMPEGRMNKGVLGTGRATSRQTWAMPPLP